MTIQIQRSRWLRGEGSADSFLLRRDEKMCCLGFYSLACGLAPEQITDKNTPYEIAHKVGGIYNLPEPLQWLVEIHSRRTILDSDDCELLMLCNDDEDIDDAAREAKIRRVFAEHGVEVVFVE